MQIFFYIFLQFMKISEIQIFITNIVFNRIGTGERMNLVPQPSLNTQSCNRRPLGSTFRFENLRSPKKKLKRKNEKISVFKQKKMKIFWPRKHEKTCFLGLRQFSNLMVLNKGLPIQDLVFRLGQTPFFLCSLYSSRVDVQKLWSCQNWWLVDFFFTLKFRISIIHAYLFPAKNSHFQNLQVLSLFSI